MDPIKEIKMFKNIPSNTYFPTVWMDSSAKIEGSAAVQIWLASNFKNIFVGFGVLMVACSLSYLIGFVVLVLCK